MDQQSIISIEQYLSRKEKRTLNIVQVSPVAGGCINETFRVDLNDSSSLFCKVNESSSFPEMFEKEVKGLEEMRYSNSVRVPEVFGCFEDNEKSFLLLEFVKEKYEVGFTGMANLGTQLAKMHKHTAPNFGLSYNNYIGSLLQLNTFKNSWIDFLIENRLSTQLKIAVDNKKMKTSAINKFENLYKKLDEIFPVEAPSLLHGDLWNGNYFIDENNKGVLFDPAIYFGHREMDLGMTKLFGGFSNDFYYAYQHYFPLEKGWDKRIAITQIYPLLVHVNLFGGSYTAQVLSIVNQFG